MSTKVWRLFDGTCNNILSPARGSAEGSFSRGIEGVQFRAAGVSERINPRTISKTLGKQPENVPLDEHGYTMMGVLFGQFINHDFEKNAIKNKFKRKFETLPLLDDNDPAC